VWQHSYWWEGMRQYLESMYCPVLLVVVVVAPGYPAMHCVTLGHGFLVRAAHPQSWENTPSNTGATLKAEG
jgi:hypothetical protein